MTRFSRLLFCAALAFLSGSDPAMAESWDIFKSPTRLYSVLLPVNPQVKTVKLRTDNRTIVVSEEVGGVLDQRPFRNTVKRYVIKMDQTFGPALKPEEANALLNAEVKTYTDYYSTMGGVLKSDEPVTVNGYPARDISIAYTDPDFGPQAVRALINITDLAKFQQIVISSEDVITSPKTKEYYESLGAPRGLVGENGVFGDGWDTYDVPSKIFTVKMPPVSQPYVPSKPALAQKDGAEVITNTVYDPVRQEKLFYVVTGRTFATPLTFKDAEAVLLKQHLSKYSIDYKGHNFQRSEDGPFPVLTFEAPIAKPKDIPYANSMRLRAVFLGNSMVVQEIVGSQALAYSNFAGNLIKQIDFHPPKMEETAPTAP